MPTPTPAKPTPPPATSLPTPAIIIVSLPADAKLTIDGVATTSTSATRRFVSPTLPLDKDFSYVLKAELTRDGKTQSTSKEVKVRAGEETHISLEFPVTVAQR